MIGTELSINNQIWLSSQIYLLRATHDGMKNNNIINLLDLSILCEKIWEVNAAIQKRQYCTRRQVPTTAFYNSLEYLMKACSIDLRQSNTWENYKNRLY